MRQTLHARIDRGGIGPGVALLSRLSVFQGNRVAGIDHLVHHRLLSLDHRRLGLDQVENFLLMTFFINF